MPSNIERNTLKKFRNTRGDTIYGIGKPLTNICGNIER